MNEFSRKKIVIILLKMSVLCTLIAILPLSFASAYFGRIGPVLSLFVYCFMALLGLIIIDIHMIKGISRSIEDNEENVYTKKGEPMKIRVSLVFFSFLSLIFFFTSFRISTLLFSYIFFLSFIFRVSSFFIYGKNKSPSSHDTLAPQYRESMPSSSRRCPVCDERYFAGATKCRSCGHVLS